MVSPSDAFDDLTNRSRFTVATGEQLQAFLLTGTAEVVRRVQLRAYQAIVVATPVDTGHARSGWVPNLGSPANDRIERPTDENVARTRASQRRAANQARAEALARSYLLRQGPVFLSNGVPYIVFLNGGSSAQAPANFVERAVRAAIASVGGPGSVS